MSQPPNVAAELELLRDYVAERIAAGAALPCLTFAAATMVGHLAVMSAEGNNLGLYIEALAKTTRSNAFVGITCAGNA